MQRVNETAGLVVSGRLHRSPLMFIEGRGGKHRRRNGKAIGGKIFEQTEGQWTCGDRSSRCCPRIFLDATSFPANGGQCVVDNNAPAVDAGACDQVDQLSPADRRIVTVFGRLVEYGQQTIVKAH